MITDKINDIIKSLIEATNSDELKWSNTGAQGSPYQSEKTLESKSEDGSSVFEISIKYTLNGDKWALEGTSGLWIRNSILPNGSMYLTSHTYPEILKLRDLLKNKYCSDISPSTKMVEDNLDGIFKGISKSNYRGNILSSIFNDKRD